MSSPTTSSPPANGSASPEAGPSRTSTEVIDASCRWPVMVLFLLGVGWLLGGGVLTVLASVKLHGPGFLAHCPWLTYGRVQAAAWHSLIYGFASQVALGAALWMMARLSGVGLPGGRGIVLATLFWNLGLKLGVWGILAGDGTGLEGLELPRYATPILLVGYLGIAAWAILTFHQRRAREVYISQWYLLGALFAFPWIYAAAQVMAVFLPVRGVLQAAVQVWYVQNLLLLWLGFVGLAALFYLLPKLTTRPVPSRNLALFGFWTLALFGSLAGMLRYHGGPFPAWMISLSVVAAVMTLFPTLTVAMNLVGLARVPGQEGPDRGALDFARLALCGYLGYGALTVVNAFAAVRRYTQYTLVTVALDQLFLLGFVSAALFGVLYHVTPKLLGRDWPSVRALKLHRLGLVSSVGLILVAYGVGGVLQGLALNDANLPFPDVLKRTVPFIGIGTLANLIFLASSLCLAWNLARLLITLCRERCLPAAKSLLQPAKGVQP